MCRKALGAVVGTFATFESGKVRWHGDVAHYDSSDQAWRGFCANCGSSVCFGYKPRPERTYIAFGIFDEPDAYPAGFHDYRGAKIEWLRIDEHLPDAPHGSPTQ